MVEGRTRHPVAHWSVNLNKMNRRNHSQTCKKSSIGTKEKCPYLTGVLYLEVKINRINKVHTDGLSLPGGVFILEVSLQAGLTVHLYRWI